MNVQREIKRINERELRVGIDVSTSASWHGDYKDSNIIYIGGLSYKVNEGDLTVVFSQWGTVNHVNLIRDKKTGKSKGYAFIGYEDQRSTILAVDNMNSIQLDGRTITVDHKKNYKPPKDSDEEESRSDEDSEKKRERRERKKRKLEEKRKREAEENDPVFQKQQRKQERKKRREESKKEEEERERLRRLLG